MALIEIQAYGIICWHIAESSGLLTSVNENTGMKGNCKTRTSWIVLAKIMAQIKGCFWHYILQYCILTVGGIFSVLVNYISISVVQKTQKKNVALSWS